MNWASRSDTRGPFVHRNGSRNQPTARVSAISEELVESLRYFRYVQIWGSGLEHFASIKIVVVFEFLIIFELIVVDFFPFFFHVFV